MTVICPDVSEFQSPLDSSYARDFVIFRGSFGPSYQDRNFLANANAAASLHAKGTLAGAVIYTVYLPGQVQAQFDFLWRLIGPTPPPWLAGIMIDVEHWGGTSYSISGDHSREINQLYGLHAHRMGSWRSVIAYGNQGDLASIYPGRDPRCRVIVAGYSSRLTYSNVRGAIGQQYTDGSSKYPTPAGLPRSSAPFGNCDHNVFPGYRNGAALRLDLRPSPVTPKPKPPVVVPAKPGLYSPGPRAIVSPSRTAAVYVNDDGRLEVHNRGHITWHS